ncbi:DUF5134 domain-containing protein [Mycolicibacterium brumae]|uniref:DUF5134 domain-containing protein n=1 Tax=Mycolicibacterium brumae TaxID=85968 RepID=A0A2G5P7L1_9MYCO|nr:DUF5134 domain-containing protein [Mycolicibacterium brumae]MCV7194211.1 DUF5134 domain-containing protein [Mycolicibacterium brumae]PIB74080.1 DUF5134 domain-containing protein [Mycolicibacterium brumae]RWA19430.1 hypothetical protein MBRU_16895 [Mycolicibacterium brumae DSM 44177]UWW08378.1 DUF5134 domain-containing protein [Mycolicibacterium brumae]
MIADPLLRWAVTALFVAAAVICLTAMASGRVSGPHWVSEVLHLAMSVAMAVMAWPWGMGVPNAPAMVVFAAGALWFLVRAITGRMCGGPIAWYHAAMMAAMAWMYAVMGKLIPGQGGDSGQDGHGGHAGHGAHGGHDGHGGSAAADPGWITGVNGFWTVFFAVAAVVLAYRYFAGRRTHSRVPEELSVDDAGVLGQAMMAAGMAIMFGVML